MNVANFAQNKISVSNKDWKKVNRSLLIPKFLAVSHHFNIEAIDNEISVMHARAILQVIVKKLLLLKILEIGALVP